MNFNFFSLTPEAQAQCLNQMRKAERLNTNCTDETQMEALLRMVSAARFEIKNTRSTKH